MDRSNDSNNEEEYFVEEIFVEDEIPQTPPNVFTLVSQVIDQFKKLVRSEIALTKTKLKKAAAQMAVGVALLVVAAVLALYMLGWLLHGVELAFALLVPVWAAALITAGILLVVILVLVSVALGALKRGKEHVPDVNEQVQTDINIIKEGLGK